MAVTAAVMATMETALATAERPTVLAEIVVVESAETQILWVEIAATTTSAK